MTPIQRLFAWFAAGCDGTGTITDVGGSGPADVYVVGVKGTYPDYPLILHFDGNVWTEDLSTEVVSPAAVWAAGKNDVFVAGQKGTIIHFDGSKWTLQSSTGNSLGFSDLHGSGPQDVYAVGQFSDLWHYDGNTWTAMLPMPAGAGSIWNDGAGHLFVGSYAGPLMLEGNEWRPLTTAKGLNGVSGYGAGEFVAVGDAGAIVQFDGARWRVVTAGQQDLRAVWGSSADTLIAVGRKGTILRHSGTGWSASPSPTDADLHGVWGASPTNVVAVGERGTVLHYDGAKWRAAPPVTTEWLADVWGTGADSIFAVGWNGTIIRFDGAAWKTMESGTRDGLCGVWGTGPGDVFAVGPSGVVLHYDGSRWSRVGSTGFPLHDVWGTGPTDLFMATGSGTVLHSDGATWNEIRPPTELLLSAAWGTRQAGLYTVGRQGTILQWRCR